MVKRGIRILCNTILITLKRARTILVWIHEHYRR